MIELGGICLALVAIVLIAIRIHDFLEGETLVGDILDEATLAAKTLEQLDALWVGNPRRADVIVSLTTIPSRLPLIEPTLKSLMRQTVAPRKIVLNLPPYSFREQRPYPPAVALHRPLACLEIREVDDLGPATKVVPTLLAEARDQAIIALDDDRIYPPRLIEVLTDAARDGPNAAFAFGGWIIPSDLVDRPTSVYTNVVMLPPAPVRATRLNAAKQVDVMLGFCGYLVRPRFFDLIALSDWSVAPPQARLVDDVWISAHCRVQKWVVPSRRSNYQPKLARRFYRRTSLGLINRGLGGDINRHNTIVMRSLRDAWTVGGPPRRAVEGARVKASDGPDLGRPTP